MFGSVCACVSALALLALVAVVPGGHACPRSCNCYQASEVHCTFRSLLSIPAGLPAHTRRINLGFNNIREISNASLAGLRRAELLMLHGNDLQQIRGGAFRDMKSLQILKLSYNKLRDISSPLTFSGLNSLLRLYLDHNLLQHVHPQALLQLPSLRLLRLQGNRLHQLHPHALCTLSLLDTYVFSTLRHLDLSNNSLTSLPEETLTTAPLLETLVLHTNPWSCDCRMNWFLTWSINHAGLMKCSQGHQCPICDSPAGFREQSLHEQSELPCSAPVISSPARDPPHRADAVEMLDAEFFRDPLGTASLGLSDHQEEDVDLACNVTRSPGVQDIDPLPDLSLSSASPLPLALSLSLDCPVERESYEKLWRILAYYTETAVHLQREIMLSKAPALAYRYRQTAETEQHYHTGVKASIRATPHWLLQSAISIRLNRAQSSRDRVNLQLSTRVAAHPDRFSHTSSSPSVSRPWVLISTNNTPTALAAVAGSKVRLPCPLLSSGNPKVQWILPSGFKVISPSASPDGELQASSSGLLLQKVKVSDAGLYYCVAKAGGDVDVLAVRLAVEDSPVPPTGEKVGSPVTGTAGDPVSLPCETSGSPSPQISWVLPDRNILSSTSAASGGLTIQSNGSLLLPRPSLNDAGQYRCVAVSQYGADSLSMQLILHQQFSQPFKTLFPRGPQSASGRSTQIQASLLHRTLGEEGSGDEEEEEDVKSELGSRNNLRPRQPPGNQRFPNGKPRRRGPMRGNAVRKGGRPLSTPEMRRNRFDSRRRVSSNKNRIDPKKWADLLAKIRQKTTQSNVSQSVTAAAPTAGPVSASDDRDTGRHKGQDDTREGPEEEITKTEGGKDDSVVTTERMEVETEESSTDDTDLQEEGLQPIYPETQTHKETKTDSETQEGTQRPAETQTDLESEMETNTQAKTESETERTTNPEKEEDPVTTVPVSKTNEIVPESVEEARQGENLNPLTARPDTHRHGFVANTVPSLRPKRPWNSRRRIGQRRRIIGGPRGRPLLPHKPLPRPTPLTAQTVTANPENTDSTTPTQISVSLSVVEKQFDQTETSSVDPNSVRGDAPPHTPTTLSPVTTTASLNSDPTSSSNAHPKVHKDILSHTNSRPDSPLLTLFSTMTPAVTQSNIAITPSPAVSLHAEPSPSTVLATSAKITSATSESARSNTLSSTASEQTHPAATETSTNTPQTTEQPAATSDTPMTTVPLTSEPTTLFTTVTATSNVATVTAIAVPPVVITSATAHPDTPVPELGTSPAAITESHSAGTTSSSRDGTNSGHVDRTGKPLAGIPNQSEPSTDWKNPGANSIPDSHSGRGRWTASPSLPASPKAPALRSRPRISDPHIRTVSFPAESTARLPCEAQGEPAPSITWTKVSTGAVMSVHSRAQRFEVLPNGTLVIQNIQLQDRGTYICSAQSFVGRDRMLTTLEVWTRPPRMEQSSYREVTTHQGGEVVLECGAHGVPAPLLSWVLPDRSVLTSSDPFHGRVTMRSNGSLHIPATLPSDRGVYRCVASNVAGAASASARVHVSSLPPKIHQPLSEHFVLAPGMPAQAHCSARGAPPPTLRWRIPDGTLVRPSQFLHGNLFVLPNGTIHIQRVGPQDAGSYECTASNAVGAERRTVRIELQRGRGEGANEGEDQGAKIQPSPPPPLEKDRIVSPPIYPENPLNSSRPSHQTPSDRSRTSRPYPSPSRPSFSPFPPILIHSPPKVSKTKAIDTHVPNPSQTNPVTPSSPAAAVPNLTKASAVTNARVTPASTVDKSKSTSVSYPSSPFSKARIVSTSPSSTSVHYGGTLLMHCTVTGNPLPNIIWRTPNRKLVDMHFSFDHRLKVHTNGTLSVQAVTEKDAGDYLCIARNKVADDYRLLRVSVTTKPAKIDPKQPVDHMVSFGGALKVDCLASGLPDPAVSWSLPDGTTVNSVLQGVERGGRARRLTVFDNGTLLVPAVGMGEEGEYTCHAENQGGQDTMKVKVKVMMSSPPTFTDNRGYYTVRVHEGATAAILCLATGDPAPTVTWLSSAGRIIPRSLGSGYYSERVVVIANGTLEVRLAQGIDAGNYTCRASNSAGEKRRVVGLEVESPHRGGTSHVGGNGVTLRENEKLWTSNRWPGSSQVSNDNGHSNDKTRNTATSSAISGPNNNLNSNSKNDSRDRINRPVSGVTTQLGSTVITVASNVVIKADNLGLNRNGPQIGSRTNSVSYSQNTVGGDGTYRIPATSPNEVTQGKTRNGASAGVINAGTSVTSRNKAVVSSGLSHNGAGADTAAENGFSRSSGAGLSNDNERGAAGAGSAARAAGDNTGGGLVTAVKRQVAKGQTVLLPCPSQGSPPPRVAWLLPGNGILPAPYYGSRLTVHRNGSLELRGVRPSDAGTLVCVVRDAQGETRNTVELVVSDLEEKPTAPYGVDRHPQTAPGLSVRTHSGTLPGSTWPLNPRSALPETIFPRNPVNQIPQRGPLLPAAPRPAASQPVVSARAAPLVSIVTGETLRLPCSAYQSLGSSQGSLSWTLPNGKVLSRGQSGDMGKYTVQPDGMLTVKQVTVFDRGTYSCRSASVDSSTVSLVTVPVIVIAYPPRITSGPAPVTYTHAGVAVELPCLTIATPRATVTWETPEMSRLRVMSQARIYGNRYLSAQGSLVIQNPTSRDRGFYRCTAQNVIGMDTKTTYLHVM